MAMKQTQTKLFDFSDAGLDFCAGSKALFPDRFKKMLALGYNVQTVTNVAIVGDQVTLTYGGAHGYVADRVLKVDLGDLSLINNGEFWIDSVTINTVTFTLDSIPFSIANGFSTRIASLGWALEYESGQVQLYKMKYLDERDLYVRLVFPPAGVGRGAINVCTGKTADIFTGIITDKFSYGPYRNNLAVAAGLEWQLSYQTVSTYDNYTYSQGFSNFGKGCVVGSAYHLLIMATNGPTGNYSGYTFGLLPTALHSFESLDYPLVMGVYNTSALTTTGVTFQFNTIAENSHFYIGGIQVAISASASVGSFSDPSHDKTVSSFYTDAIEGFNTSAAYPIMIFEKQTRQHLGFVAAGLYRFDAKYGVSPPLGRTEQPSTMMDVDLSNMVKIHVSHASNNLATAMWFCTPIEEVKIAT